MSGRYRIDLRYYVEAENGAEAIRKVEEGEIGHYSLCCVPLDRDAATAVREMIFKSEGEKT